MRESGKYCQYGMLSFCAVTRIMQNLCVPACVFLVLFFVQPHIVYAEFNYTGIMSESRRNHTATNLSDGRVLITGGFSGSTNIYRNSAEIYDPVTGIFTPTGNMTTKRAYHTATLLSNGKVLITGGKDGVSVPSLSSAEIFDPATGLFTPTEIMTDGRIFHTATQLPDGKVLIAGGQNSTAYNAPPLNSAEIFDPTTGINGTFTPTGSMTTTRTKHTTTLLNDGTVLVAGGQSGGSAGTALASAQIYNPDSGSFFSEIGPLAVGRTLHTATLLIDGRVLLAGGYNLKSTELFNPTGSGTGTFSASANMSSVRDNHTATRLLNGKILFAGGYDGINYLANSLLFNPPSGGSFSDAGTMNSTRSFHSATLLNNGNVLISGGISTFNVLTSSELYNPGGVIKVSPVAYTFTDVYVSDPPTPNSQSFTITNSSAGNLTLNDITISGPDGPMFPLDMGSCGPLPFTLSANGGNCSIIVSFNPTTGGTKSASIDITSTDPEKPLLSTALSGTGLTVTFSIYFNGTGAGSTASIQEGLTCQSSSNEPCQDQVGLGKEISIFAVADKDSIFAGWPDDCIISDNNGCTIMVYNDSSVTAGFNYIEPARISSTYYPSLNDAYAGAVAGVGSVIETRSFSFSGPVIFDGNIKVTLKGGYDLNYTSNQDYTVVNNGLTIRSGQVIAEKIVVRGGN